VAPKPPAFVDGRQAGRINVRTAPDITGNADYIILRNRARAILTSNYPEFEGRAFLDHHQ
jgi:hypothetical protein